MTEQTAFTDVSSNVFSGVFSEVFSNAFSNARSLWQRFAVESSRGGRSLEERKQDLRRLRLAIVKFEAEICRALHDDLHKSEFEAWTSEIGFVLSEIDHAIKNLQQWLEIRSVSTPAVFWPARSEVRRKPKGVVLIIAPWNYPFQLSLGPLVGALAAGCPAVLKPSEFTPATSRIIERLISETFPSDQVSVCCGDAGVAQGLLKLPFAHIFFTGSTRVGREVMRAAAEHLASVTLELGGKSPVVILRSARLRVAARRTVFGKLLNAGQTCVAPDYVLVERSAKEEFVNECRRAVTDFLGESQRTNPQWGRIVNEAHFDRLLSLLPESSVERQQCVRSERYMPFVILDGCTWDSPAMNDEIFGPILPVIAVDDLNEALVRVRERPSPLAAYLFSERTAEQERFLGSVLAGGVCINDTVLQVANPHLPFGGVGPSGMGSSHGEMSFLAFTHEQSIMHARTFPDLPIRYPPYSNRILGLLRRMSGW